MIDNALRVSLWRNGIQIEVFAAQSGEGAIEFAVEMLRRLKRLEAGDMFVVESLADTVAERSMRPGSLQITVQPGSVR